jgi:CubicO group peptidase (beta-lactamase class C family)
MKKLIILTFLLLAISLTTYAQQDTTTLQERVAAVLRKEFSQCLSEKPDFGGAIAVVDDKHIVWEETFGSVNGKETRLIDVNTIFSIQSMSKSFTALAVMMAVQDGLLDIDTPIKEYLPDFRINSLFDEHPEELITLRLLLSHRAGLTHEAPYGSNFDDRNDFNKHIQSISDTWLQYPVGYRMKYSNLGIDLAGYILQVKSGMPFERYVKEKVLTPIGMDSSLLDMTVIEKTLNRAIGHSSHGEILPLRIPMIPAGGVYSSIRDMAKYLQFHINKGVVNGRRILRADLMEEMHTVQFARRGQRCGYGLGINRDPVSNSYNLYHSGGGYGFSSDMVMYPDLKLGVVVLWNFVNEDFTGIRIRSYPDSCVIAQNGDTPIDSAGTNRMIKLTPDDPRIQGVLGYYGDYREGTLSIERNDNNVGLRVAPDQFHNLEFYNNSGEMVGMVGRFSEVHFLPPYSGKRGSLYIINRRLGTGQGYQTYDFNHVANEPCGPNKPEWSKYLGEYQVLKYGVPFQFTASITVKNGYLCYNDIKCTEYEPGFFFSYDNSPLDFRSEIPTFGGIVLHKK